MPTRYEDHDRPASQGTYENAIANTSILYTPDPIYTTTEAEDTRSTITAFEEVYHVEEGEVPQFLPPVDDIPDSPIHYEDDDTPEDLDVPDLPFFPNHPTSHRFFPLEIPLPDGSKVLAKYIHYTNQGMTVVGCMSRSEPRYGCPVYLTNPHASQIPEALTGEQILHFHRNNVRADAIDRAVSQMNNPRVEAEISRLRNSLELGDRLERQLGEIRQQEQLLVAKKWDNDAAQRGIKRRMEAAHLYRRISERYVNMTPHPTRPRPRDTSPLVPRAHGPLEMPKLHGNHRVPPPRLCWKCNSPQHVACDCPLKTKNRHCKHCSSDLHWSNRCLFKRLNVLEALNRQPSTPKWCGKCFRHNPGHEELQCPSYEYCRTCGQQGPFLFLRKHRCTTPQEVDMTNDPDADVYNLIDWEAT